MSPARLALVAAVARNGVIGADGDMPWRLSSDLKHFRALTMGHAVIMGRKTFQTIGRPLDGRTNIVLSRDPTFAADDVTVVSDLVTAIESARADAARRGDDEIFVIGGGTLYAEALPLADRLYITHVDVEPEGDTRFPPIDEALFQEVDRAPLPRGPRDTAAAEAAVYVRRPEVAADGV